MKKIVFASLIAIMSLGCGTNLLNKASESKVTVSGKEYKVFYEVKREQGDMDWEGERFGTVEYNIRDEATKNSKFYVVAIYDTRYIRSSLRFMAYPMYFSEVNSHSFLQKIIIENNGDRGQEIFRNIFDQLEQSRNK